MDSDVSYLFEPIESGLWQPPQWLGGEIKPMALCIFTPIVGILSHTPWFFVTTLVAAVGCGFWLRMMFEVEPCNFEIILRHRRIGRHATFLRLPLFLSPAVRFARSNR